MVKRLFEKVLERTWRIDVGKPYRDSARQRSYLPIAMVPADYTQKLCAFELPVTDINAASLRPYLPSAPDRDLRQLATEIRRAW